MADDGPIRVLLVDDHAYVGETLARTFRQVGGIELVGQMLRPEGLVEMVRDGCPDVVMMDFWIPGWDTTASVGDLLRACPEIAVLVYTGMMSTDEERAVLAAGAIACVGKYQPITEMVQAIREAAAYSRGRGGSDGADRSGAGGG